MKAIETNVHKLLQGTKVFLVPNFQRRYAWRLDEWRDLWSDILTEFEALHGGPQPSTREIDGHFLGSVVLHPAAGPASTVTKHLIIDGQQRLTTLLVLIAVLRDLRKASDPSFDTGKYVNQYLTNPYDPEDHQRLVPTALDREAYESTIMEGRPRGGIGQAYEWFRDAISQLIEDQDDPQEAFQRLETAILLRLVFVEITTGKDDAINTIFNTLNSKGKPLSAADLIRNELLLYLEVDEANSLHEKLWLPVERSLTHESRRKIDDSRLVGYFLAREMIHSPGVASKDLFNPFQRRMKNAFASHGSKAVRTELKDIHADHDVYRAVIEPAHAAGRAARIPAGVREMLTELSTWGSAPHIPVTYAATSIFLQRGMTETELVTSLHQLLSYLVRRTLAGYATNNLNRMLSPVPAQLHKAPSPGTFLQGYLSREAMHWPTDEVILDTGPWTPLYLNAKRAQVHYILSKLELALQPKEPVDARKLQIEHILPQKPGTEWLDDLASWGESFEDLRPILHTLGNLTLTGLNPTLSNHSFETKSANYRESPLALNKEIVNANKWTSIEIEARAYRLLARSTGLWRGPQGVTKEEPVTEEQIGSVGGLKDVLNSMPDGAWTTVEELVEALGMDEETVRLAVSQLPDVLRRLVGRQLKGESTTTPGTPMNAMELAAAAGWGDSEDDDSVDEADSETAL